MTREEAAEIILAEQPFRLCEECKGSGTVTEGNGNWVMGCDNCSATGVKANPQYRAACTILQLRMPQLIHE